MKVEIWWKFTLMRSNKKVAAIVQGDKDIKTIVVTHPVSVSLMMLK